MTIPSFFTKLNPRFILAAFLSHALVSWINPFLKNLGIGTNASPMILICLTLILFLMFNFLVRKVVIPIIFFSLYFGIMCLGIVKFSEYFQINWVLKNNILQIILFSVIILLPFSLKIYFFYKNRFILKSLKEIDNLGDGDSKKGGFLFEEYLAQLYRKLGYEAQTISQLKKEGKVKSKGFDQGADLIINFTQDNEQIRAVVQCKLYSSAVGNKAIQEVLASKAIYNANAAIVVTNNYFTEAAIELANANNVLLVNRDNLKYLLEKASSQAK